MQNAGKRINSPAVPVPNTRLYVNVKVHTVVYERNTSSRLASRSTFNPSVGADLPWVKSCKSTLDVHVRRKLTDGASFCLSLSLIKFKFNQMYDI